MGLAMASPGNMGGHVCLQSHWPPLQGAPHFVSPGCSRSPPWPSATSTEAQHSLLPSRGTFPNTWPPRQARGGHRTPRFLRTWVLTQEWLFLSAGFFSQGEFRKILEGSVWKAPAGSQGPLPGVCSGPFWTLPIPIYTNKSPQQTSQPPNSRAGGITETWKCV